LKSNNVWSAAAKVKLIESCVSNSRLTNTNDVVVGDQVVGFTLLFTTGFTAVSPSEKLSFGVASFEELVDLLPPSAKLSLGGANLEVDSLEVAGLVVLPRPELFNLRGLSAGGVIVDEGVFEEDMSCTYGCNN